KFFVNPYCIKEKAPASRGLGFAAGGRQSPCGDAGPTVSLHSRSVARYPASAPSWAKTMCSALKGGLPQSRFCDKIYLHFTPSARILWQVFNKIKRPRE